MFTKKDTFYADNTDGAKTTSPDGAGFKQTPYKLLQLRTSGVIDNKVRNRVINNSDFPVVNSGTIRQARSARIGSFKKGGIVHKTGVYRLHKGEVVVPKDAVDKAHKNWTLSDSGAVKY